MDAVRSRRKRRSLTCCRARSGSRTREHSRLVQSTAAARPSRCRDGRAGCPRAPSRFGAARPRVTWSEIVHGEPGLSPRIGRRSRRPCRERSTSSAAPSSTCQRGAGGSAGRRAPAGDAVDPAAGADRVAVARLEVGARERPAHRRQVSAILGPEDAAAHLAQRLAAEDDLVAVLEERPRRAVAERQRLARRSSVSSIRLPSLPRSAPEIVPEANRSPVRTLAPLTVACASCCGIVQ